MKTQRVTQAKQDGVPASQHDDNGRSVQLKADAASPRQTQQAKHIAQLKGEAKGKAPAKKGKGK